MKTDVLNWEKKKVGQVDLSPEVFEKPVRKDLLHTVVRWQLACRRQGTHKAKTPGEVSGGGKKPFKQKGTGQARQGSSRASIMVGGGVAFGPVPRSYAYHLPKGIRLAGLKSALSYLAGNGKFFVVDSMSSDEGKTKELAQRLKNFGLEKAVLIDSGENDLFKRASNNLKGVRYYPVSGMNVYDLLKYDAAIVTKDAVKAIEARCGVEK